MTMAIFNQRTSCPRVQTNSSKFNCNVVGYSVQAHSPLFFSLISLSIYTQI